MCIHISLEDWLKTYTFFKQTQFYIFKNVDVSFFFNNLDFFFVLCFRLNLPPERLTRKEKVDAFTSFCLYGRTLKTQKSIKVSFYFRQT